MMNNKPSAKKVLTLAVPADFNFWHTIYSHGWCSLRPFFVDKERHTFELTMNLQHNRVVRAVLSEGNEGIDVELSSSDRLNRPLLDQAKQTIADCFRLSEDFSEFFKFVNRLPEYRWMRRHGSHRFLRAPTVFEDVIKTIATTNCTWALTTVIVNNLVDKVGNRFDETRLAFPTPEALADVSESFLRKEIKAGYRAPYILECARRVANNKLDIETLRSVAHDPNVSTPDLIKILRSIKGIGPYSAGNMLKVLGRYDDLALDSWVRQRFYEIHSKGRVVKDSRIESFYKPLGKWRGLIFWLEMTRHWHTQKFPF
jgi:N-glycosylase/DNA lyase